MKNKCCLICSHSGKVSPLTELITCTKYNYGVSPNSLACKNFELENKQISMECVKLSEFIKCLENIYSEKGELDLFSWNGAVTDLKTFIQVDDQVIIIDQQGIDTED